MSSYEKGYDDGFEDGKKDAEVEVEEEVAETPINVDNKGNRIDYEQSAYARPRTQGKFRHGNPLDDRTSGHS